MKRAGLCKQLTWSGLRPSDNDHISSGALAWRSSPAATPTGLCTPSTLLAICLPTSIPFALSVRAIQIAIEFEGHLLVAVPLSVWHRAIARRVLARTALSRATLVEIQAAHPDQLDVPIERMGGLVPSYEMCWRFFGGVQCRALLRQRPRPLCSSTCPGLGGRCAGAFCFLFGRSSLDRGSGRGDIRRGRPLGEPDIGLDGLPLTESEIRLSRLEDACSPAIERRGEVAGVLKGNCASATCCSSVAGQAKACRPKAYACCWASLDLKTMYPLLDPGVASAALQAGIIIPHSNLEAMQVLLGQGSKAAKTKDMSLKVTAVRGGARGRCRRRTILPGDCGFAAGDPMASTLTKLAAIVEILTDNKVKKINQSKLESALDTGAVGSSDTPLQGTGKKAAAARRALRHAFEHQPQEIADLIERLMFEDFSWTTLGPGMPPRSLNSGRTPVPCDSSQERSSCCLGRCRSSAQLDCGATPSCGAGPMPSGHRQRSLKLGFGAFIGASAAASGSCCPSAPCNREWRISLLSSLRRPLGRLGIGPSEGPGRLLGQTPQHWEGCPEHQGRDHRRSGRCRAKGASTPKGQAKSTACRRSPRRLAG